MKNFGKTDIQYAQCLWGPNAAVLNSKRDRGDNTSVTIISDEDNQLIKLIIEDDLNVELMTSSTNAGAKKRIDIHIADEHLNAFIEMLEAIVKDISIKFDEASRQSPDPTGMEHPDGLDLGKTEPITWVQAECSAYFKTSDVLVSTTSSGQIYLDAEKYSRGRRIHLGIRNIQQKANELPFERNFIELKIPYSQSKRFLHSIKVGKKWIQ